MIAKACRALVVLLVLTISLFSISNQASASPDVGLSVAGPLLNSSYQVVAGQVVDGFLVVTNTGSECTLRFSHKIISGPSQSVNVTTPGEIPRIPPDTATTANFSFHVNDNASGIVTVKITATATVKTGNGSIAEASVSGLVYFVIDPNAFSVRVRVIDQYGWPVRNSQIELVRGFLSYVEQDTDDNGTTRFLLSGGLYTLRCFMNGFLEKTATLNISEDRLFAFSIIRSAVVLTQPPSVPLVGYGIIALLSYLVGTYRQRKRTSKKTEAPRSEFDLWFRWSEEDLS